MSQVIIESPVVRRCDDQDQGSPALENKVKLYNKGTLNHVDLSTVHQAPYAVSGLITINSTLAIALLDPRSTHCFISSKYAATHQILRRPMDKPMLVKSQRKKLRATHQCPNVNLNIKGANFKVNLIVLESLEIDVVLGQGWFARHQATLNQAQRSVSLTAPSGEKMEYEDIQPQLTGFEGDAMWAKKDSEHNQSSV
jgi:hypothetical protein